MYLFKAVALKKPSNIKDVELDVYEDGSGYAVDILGSTYNHSWNGSPRAIIAIHKKLGEIITYVECKRAGRNAKKSR